MSLKSCSMTSPHSWLRPALCRSQQGAPDGSDASWQLAMHRPKTREERAIGEHRSLTCCLITQCYVLYIFRTIHIFFRKNTLFYVHNRKYNITTFRTTNYKRVSTLWMQCSNDFLHRPCQAPSALRVRVSGLRVHRCLLQSRGLGGVHGAAAQRWGDCWLGHLGNGQTIGK